MTAAEPTLAGSRTVVVQKGGYSQEMHGAVEAPIRVRLILTASAAASPEVVAVRRVDTLGERSGGRIARLGWGRAPCRPNGPLCWMLRFALAPTDVGSRFFLMAGGER